MAANLDAQTFLRRIEILQRLPAKGTSPVSARTLTEQLHGAGYAVEKRTVERDLEFLRDHGQWFGTLHCDDRGKPYGRTDDLVQGNVARACERHDQLPTASNASDGPA